MIDAFATSSRPDFDGGRLSLLVIEDALIHRTIISRIADKSGFSTVAASSIEAAAERLRSRDFDCITLDLSLGEEVGGEFLRLLADRKCQTPVIIISGSDAEVVEETSRLGRALDINLRTPLHKPIDLGLLRDMLEQIRACSGRYRLASV